MTHADGALLSDAHTRYMAKITRTRTGGYRAGDFLLADAKDADLSGGVLTTGPRRSPDGRITGSRTRPDFLAEMRGLLAQDVIDILLASRGSIEVLADDGAFAGSAVMPAFRANETTCVWGNLCGGRYREAPSRPHQGAALEFARAPLCLYSITFLNDAERDAAALEAYAAFRREARGLGIMHFLEVFKPNIDIGVAPEAMGSFVNDCIVRALASLTRAERPEFLKVAYNGPEAVEELVARDPSVVVGVLGYHADLSRAGILADRDLDSDLGISEDSLRRAATPS